MTLLHRALWMAVRKVAADPRVRAKAVQVFDDEVKPRAAAAWERTKPRIETAKAELKQIAAETDPRKDPRGFAAKVKARFLDDDDR